MAKEKDMNNESEGSLLKGAISALQAENEKAFGYLPHDKQSHSKEEKMNKGAREK